MSVIFLIRHEQCSGIDLGQVRIASVALAQPIAHAQAPATASSQQAAIFADIENSIVRAIARPAQYGRRVGLCADPGALLLDGLCFPLISCVRIVGIGMEELLTVDFVVCDCLLSLG